MDQLVERRIDGKFWNYVLTVKLAKWRFALLPCLESGNTLFWGNIRFNTKHQRSTLMPSRSVIWLDTIAHDIHCNGLL